MNRLDSKPWAQDRIDRAKLRLKQFPSLYSFAILFLSPVYPQGWIELRQLRRELESDDVAMNLGSGPVDLGPKFINVDIMPYACVDIVADLESLPVRESSVDLIVNLAVLEHVVRPYSVMREIHRVLRPGGRLLLFVPFIQGYHASPHDYHRFTRTGILELVAPLKVQKLVNVGPTSGLIWIVAEWVAIVLSFGSERMQGFLAQALSVLLSPLKFLDYVLRRAPGADNIASGFIVLAMK